MTIGQALRKIRQNLDLTQKEMAANIVTRPFYAKVEAGKSRISADKLAAILFEHDVDITYFYQLLRATYTSKQKKIESDLNNKMEQAFNVGKIDEIESCYQEILFYVWIITQSLDSFREVFYPPLQIIKEHIDCYFDKFFYSIISLGFCFIHNAIAKTYIFTHRAPPQILTSFHESIILLNMHSRNR